MDADTQIPGFVDLQVNGFVGVDFTAETVTEEECARAYKALIGAGTTAFLSTIITAPVFLYERNIKMMTSLGKSSEFNGQALGFHLEGPFISAETGAVGAHDEACVRPPDVGLLEKMQNWSEGTIKMLTVAPEVPGMDELIRAAVNMGITVSLGHSLASADDIERAVDAGATSCTHLGNGIPNMVNRHHNPMWSLLSEERLSYMVISDGHHLPKTVLKTIYRVAGPDKFIVVSDAASPAGLPPGKYRVLGNDAVLEESGLLHNPEKGCMVGSAATMFSCMNHLASLGFMNLEDMLKAGFYNPLKLIGVDRSAIATGASVKYINNTFVKS